MSTTPIEEFAIPEDRTEKFLAYPFRRPEGSFMVTTEGVIDVARDYQGFCEEVNDYLTAHNLEPLEARVPIIAYGSNSNPAQIQERMTKYAQPGAENALQTIPHQVATIPDAAVVWHGKPSQAGGVFAELYRGDDTQDVTSQVHLAYMTAGQIASLHASEGITYRLTEMTVLAGEDHRPITAYAYVAGKSVVLQQNGEVVKVRREGEPKVDGAMSVEEAVEFMLEHAADAAGAENARDLIASTESMKLAQKKEMQARISDKLGQLGLNRDFSFPSDEGSRIGRADFNWLHKPHYGLVQLAEQSLEYMRPTREMLEAKQRELMAEKGYDEETAMKKARRALDIMDIIRQRAHDELAERISN